MANPTQRLLSYLFNLKTDQARNAKLEMLPVAHLELLHSHMLESSRWDTYLTPESLKNPEQSFYNPEMDIEFRYQFITEESEAEGLLHYMVCAKQEMNFLDSKLASGEIS